MATYYKASRHDIGITDPSTADVLGFVCSVDKNQVPIYAELDAQRLVDLFTTTPTQVSTDPMKELILGSDTHHAGIGGEYDQNPKKYFQSFGMDLSVKGQAMAGWSSTGISSTPTKPTLTTTNFDMESATGTGWVNGQGTWIRDDTYSKADTYSWYGNNAQANDYFYQDLDIFVPGAEYTFTLWGTSTGAKRWKIGINDSVDTTYGTTVTTSVEGTFEQSTVTKTLSAAASRLRIIFEAIDGNNNYWADVAAITNNYTPVAGTSPAYCQAEFNSKLYIALGKQLCKLNSGGTAFDIVALLPATITSLVPFRVSLTDYLFIFQGTGATYYQMTTAEVLTINDLTVKTFEYGAWVNTTVDTMYANDGGNTVRSTVNPLAGGTQWSAQTVVGEAATPITALKDKDGALLIDKEDMPFYLDSSGNVQKDLAPEAASGKSTHSGKNSTIWQGIYYRPTGDQALLASGKYTDGTLGKNEWVQPARYTSNNSEFVGQVEAVVGDEEWLYLASDNSTKAMIFKGRPEVIDGVTRQVWHPFHELTITGIEAMWTSTVYKKRLWFSSTTASENIFYLPLPTKYGDITADAERTFKTDTYFITSGQHGGFKADDKQLIKVDATLGHTYDADIYFECWYKVLGGSWVDLGDMIGTATNRTHTLYRATATTSPMFAFKFVAKTDDTTKTPILVDYKAKTLLFAEDKKIIYTKVRVGSGVINKDGSKEKLYVTQKTCMDNMRAATNHITMTNLDGTTKYVRMLTLPESPNWAWRKPIRMEKNEVIEWEYTLLLLEIKLS